MDDRSASSTIAMPRIIRSPSPLMLHAKTRTMPINADIGGTRFVHNDLRTRSHVRERARLRIEHMDPDAAPRATPNVNPLLAHGPGLRATLEVELRVTHEPGLRVPPSSASPFRSIF